LKYTAEIVELFDTKGIMVYRDNILVATADIINNEAVNVEMEKKEYWKIRNMPRAIVNAMVIKLGGQPIKKKNQ
jgi:hypothetical protein